MNVSTTGRHLKLKGSLSTKLIVTLREILSEKSGFQNLLSDNELLMLDYDSFGLWQLCIKLGHGRMNSGIFSFDFQKLLVVRRDKSRLFHSLIVDEKK